MLDGFERPTYVGVIFDMDDYTIGKQNALGAIKKILSDFVTKIGINSRLFVAGNENLPKTHGESVYQVTSYSGRSDTMSLDVKFKDCIHGIGAQENCNKYVILITNRYGKNFPHHYEKALKINQIKEYGCEVIIFEMRTSTQQLSKLADEYKSKYVFVNEMQTFNHCIQEILKEIGHG